MLNVQMTYLCLDDTMPAYLYVAMRAMVPFHMHTWGNMYMRFYGLGFGFGHVWILNWVCFPARIHMYA